MEEILMRIMPLIAGCIIGVAIATSALAETIIEGYGTADGGTAISIKNPRPVTDSAERLQNELNARNISYVWVTAASSVHHKIYLLDDTAYPADFCKLAVEYDVNVYSVENTRTTIVSYCSEVARGIPFRK